MSGSEYKAIRERLGLTQALLGEQVGRSRKVINEREQAEEIPIEAALAIQMVDFRSRQRIPKQSHNSQLD